VVLNRAVAIARADKAVLFDAQFSVKDGEKLVEMINKSGKKLTHIVITRVLLRVVGLQGQRRGKSGGTEQGGGDSQGRYFHVGFLSFRLQTYNPQENAIFAVNSTLASGPHEAVLFDAQFSVKDGEKLVEMINKQGQRRGKSGGTEQGGGDSQGRYFHVGFLSFR
jgi:hypothetical protein